MSIEDVIIIVLSDVTCRAVMKPLCLSVLTCTALVSYIISLEWKERRKIGKIGCGEGKEVEERKREGERDGGEKEFTIYSPFMYLYNTCTSSVLSLSLSVGQGVW